MTDSLESVRAPRPPMTAWPVQLQLPGQAAAPDGPVDLTPMFVLHHGFRRDLRRFLATARTLPGEDMAGFRALRRRWDLFAEILHHHHEGEDSGLWPLLRSLTGADDRALLEAMEAEHALVDPALAAVADAFDAVLGRVGPIARRRLVDRLMDLQQVLDVHLAHEERDALPIVQRTLTQGQWEELERTHFRRGLSLGDLVRMVPWVVDGLPADARQRMLGNAPLPIRVVWRLAHRGFERREAAVFGSAAALGPAQVHP